MSIEKVVKRNSIFKPLWETKKRYVVMLGSAGSGKSVDTAQFYISRILSEKGRNLLCIRKVAQSNSVSTYNELKKAAVRMGVENMFSFKTSPNLQVDCINGNQILFGGVKDDSQREKLKSITAACGNLTDVWIEEATEISKEDFEIIDDRLRGKLPEGLFYQIRLTFNPVSSSHWIKKAFFDYKDENVITHRSTYLDNAFCDSAYHKRMERRKVTDPDGYRVYGLGQWGESGGVILPWHIIENFDISDERFDRNRYGQDFGFNHANVLLDVGIKDGEVYVKREIYVKEKTTEEIINMCNFKKSILMYCDSAEPDRIATWQQAGYNAVGVKKYPGSVNAAIDWLKGRKIHIHPSCKGTIGEIESWCWRKDANGDYTDEPVNFKDDAMAALRYAVCEFILTEAEKEQTKENYIYNFASERPTANSQIEKVIVI